MLRSIKLKCFRQHKDRTFNFGPGLNAIKGPNEGGKSTIVQAVLYAIFGSKALPEALSDVVTWGHKETELEVVLTIEIGGRLFNFKRSKGGAEAQYDGGIVTGQNEVSNFAAEILGGDANMMQKLMLANQNNLRGALEEGPKAVAQQIETLADFDLFDRLIERMQEKLPLGSTAAVEDRIKRVEKTLEETPAPEAPDLASFDIKAAGLEGAVKSREDEIKRLQPLRAEREAELHRAQVAARTYQGVQNDLKRAKEQRDLHVAQRTVQLQKASAPRRQAELDQLREQVRDAAAAIEKRKVFEALQKLEYPSVFLEGSDKSFYAEIDRLNASISANKDEASNCKLEAVKFRSEAREFRSKIVNSLTCPTCKREIEDAAAMRERNAENEKAAAAFDEKARLMDEKIRGFEDAVVTLRAERDELHALRVSAIPFEDFIAQHGHLLEVDSSVFPRRLSWKGAEPECGVNVEEARKRISEIEGEQEAADAAKYRAEALIATIDEDNERIARLEGNLEEIGECPDTSVAQDAFRQVDNRIETCRIENQRDTGIIADLRTQKALAEGEYKAKLQARAQAEDNLKLAREEFDTIVFNNALMKKIRAARPLVADKLWSMVLTSVSTMFSDMRGQKSVVTKCKEGFKVNGTPATSLSGSTLDILGLAIRVALLKTFLPSTSMLTLDEPCHGMDVQRTADTLGFLASVGFNQTIVISHEEATEAAADHVIEV